MYSPKHFEETRPEVLHSLVHSQPLCTLVTLSDEGLVADPIPLLLRAEVGKHGTLVGHVARANSLWRATRLDTPVLAIFQGPQHYISPNWYPGKHTHGKAVPTWNYVTVQAKGLLQVHHDPLWVRAQVAQLTGQQERISPKPWTVDEAPPDYTETMLKAIVGISIAVTQWTGKWKVSQNQTPANRSGVLEALGGLPSDQAQAMAAAVLAHASGQGGSAS